MLYILAAIGFLLVPGIVRFGVRWRKARSLGAPLAVAQLMGLMIRKTPVDKFIDVYAGLLRLDLIPPWNPQSAGPHPLESVSLRGGCMSAVAEQWKRACADGDAAISLEDFIQGGGRHALEASVKERTEVPV